MTEELTLRAYAERRDLELRRQIAALKGQLALIQAQIAQRENELGQITHIRASLTIAGGAGLAQGVVPHGGSPQGVANRPPGFAPGPGPYPGEHPDAQASINERFELMTIKELVVQALLDHFLTGAQASLLRDFIRDAYGRVIQPSSLRPQLHRLKDTGILYHDTASDLWNLTPKWRSSYVLTNPPITGNILELEHDEVPEAKGTGDLQMDSELLKLAESLAWRDEDDSEQT